MTQSNFHERGSSILKKQLKIKSENHLECLAKSNELLLWGAHLVMKCTDATSVRSETSIIHARGVFMLCQSGEKAARPVEKHTNPF